MKVEAPAALLLVEPQFLLRRTVAAVARELALADVHESTSVGAADGMLASQRFDGMLLSLDEAPDDALMLLERLREANHPARGVRVAVSTGACSPETALRLKALDVRRVLLKPYKVKTVIETIAALWPRAGA